MKRIIYVLWMIVVFPLDLFRFTVDAWRYTFEWFSYCILGNSKEQPCIFCRGLDLGTVPRRVSTRIHYRNLWLVRLMQPELEVRPAKDRCRPRVACMKEGGYLRLPRYIPLLAVVLGALWIAAFCLAIWHTDLLPTTVRDHILDIMP